MNFNLIGAGRLGGNIAISLIKANIATLNTVVNRHIKGATDFCQSTGYGTPAQYIKELPPVDLTWITVNDDAIAGVVSQLMNNNAIKSGSMVIHCSGVLSSALLSPLRSKGCVIASCHPLKAFKTHILDAKSFEKTTCVIEGDEVACSWLEKAFSVLGAELTEINPQAKSFYHAGASMAANYLVTLAYHSHQLLLKAGFTKKHAGRLIKQLMQGSLNNIQEEGCIAEALTGPLMRGDLNTLNLHIQALQEAPAVLNLYTAAGLATLPLTQLQEKTRREISQMLIDL